MKKDELNVGDVISGLEHSELVKIQAVKDLSEDKVVIKAVGIDSKEVIEIVKSIDEMDDIYKVRGDNYSFDGDPERFLLGAEAQRIKTAYQFDPLFAVNSSVIDPLPHQIEAVYKYLLPLPRIRFLLADDTGAGKTIMAGLILKELLFRGVIKKILIITPGGLTKQWQEDELLAKFGMNARLVNRASFLAEPSQFSRYTDGIFVVSIDFISRNESCLNAAEATQWDFVVVDEAHKLSAYEFGKKLEESKRYKAVKTLSEKTDHLLFMTATPHRGRKDTFRRLLMLLDRDLFQKDEYVSKLVREQSKRYFPGDSVVKNQGGDEKVRNRFFLRRLKEEMVNWDKMPLFKERHTKTVGYDLTPEEKELYERVTSYVSSRRRQAKEKKNQNVQLTLMVMQRRLASSIYAITKTLENRLSKLHEVLEILNSSEISNNKKKTLLRFKRYPDDPVNISQYEDLTEEEREEIDERIFRQVVTSDPQEVQKEIEEINSLLVLARGLKNHKEAKFKELLKVLDSSGVIRDADEKLLIFTEHKDTLKSLSERLVDKGYSIVNIHGSMDVDARKEAQRDFNREKKIMVATDAAGEGINLQFCRYLINWDIPWNPNRLEQRMGRIHRYGQKDDVWVYNLVAQNTREGAVLKKVLSKLDIMREQMGSDRVYDVIDDLFKRVPLVKLIEQAIDSEDEETLKTAESRLDNITEEEAKELIQIQEKKSLTARLDLKAVKELKDTSDEKKLQPCFVNTFFEKAWAKCGGSIRNDGFLTYLNSVPESLLKVANSTKMPLSKNYNNAFVFNKDLLSVVSEIRVPEYTQLLGPGHYLFDVLIEWAIKNAKKPFAKGVKLIDPSRNKVGKIALVRSTIIDSRQDKEKRVANEKFSVVIHSQNGMKKISPAYLLSCTSPENDMDTNEISVFSDDDIKAWSYENITSKQLDQVMEIRKNECDLRREYLEKTFTDLIIEKQNELNTQQKNQLLGNADLEKIRNLEHRLEQLKDRKQKRLRELDAMINLNANFPEVITQAVIFPHPNAIDEEDQKTPPKGFPMRRNDEVEKIAMDITMKYERNRGWVPEDVHELEEHYDIRSTGPGGEKRYIEVKGRAKTGAIIITEPELNKLKQLKENAWLYIVTFCMEETPNLRLIKDPANKLSPEKLYRQVQYFVTENDWRNFGEEIERI